MPHGYRTSPEQLGVLVHPWDEVPTEQMMFILSTWLMGQRGEKTKAYRQAVMEQLIADDLVEFEAIDEEANQFYLLYRERFVKKFKP